VADSVFSGFLLTYLQFYLLFTYLLSLVSEIFDFVVAFLH